MVVMVVLQSMSRQQAVQPGFRTSPTMLDRKTSARRRL